MASHNIAFYDAVADYYDVIHGDREEEFDFYRRVIGAGSDVLEVGCGSGTLTGVLAGRGAQVTGLDASDAMLAHARARLPDQTFIKADMRRFDLGCQFDVVLCPFNTLMHLHTDLDVINALQEFGRHCRPEGQIIIDMYHIEQRFIAPVAREFTLRDGIDDSTGDYLKATETSQLDEDRRIMTIRWHIQTGREPGHMATSEFSYRMFQSDEMTALCAAAGLVIERKEGTYDGRPFSTTQPRQIISARPVGDCVKPPQMAAAGA